MYYNITIVAYHDVCLSKNGECTRKTIVRVGSDVLYIYMHVVSNVTFGFVQNVKLV